MIREKGGGFEAKQEGDHTNESSSKLVPQPSSYSSSSSSRQWSSGFSRNPRIVRVSRSFGGKDRHSKVCTIRGLRDRRIRLSVPTAIQLYDLQDRLGLTQPSKVIDWLLDVTKNDIDKLPPLQIPQGLFGHHHQQQQQPMMQSIDHEDQDQSLMRATGKEVERDYDGDKNIAMPILNPYYYHWDPSNLSLSQFGSSGQEFMSQSQAQQQAADHQNSLLYGNAYHHLFVCPPPAAAAARMPSLFPTYDVSNAQEEGSHDQYSSRQLINHFQLLSSNSSSSSSPQLPINSLATSSSSQVKPFSLNVTGSYPDKEDT